MTVNKQILQGFGNQFYSISSINSICSKNLISNSRVTDHVLLRVEYKMIVGENWHTVKV